MSDLDDLHVVRAERYRNGATGSDKRMDAESTQKTIISEGASMEDTQNAVNSEITNILNKLSLLSNDVKGSAIDNQI